MDMGWHHHDHHCVDMGWHADRPLILSRQQPICTAAMTHMCRSHADDDDDDEDDDDDDDDDNEDMLCSYDPNCGSELCAIADNVRKYVDSSVLLDHLPNTQYVPILHIYHFYTLAHLEA